MAEVIGAQIEQLQQLEVTFKNQAGNVESMTKGITSQLGSTQWEGPAADRFRSAWSGEFAPMLNKLVTALTEASQEIDRRRNALIQAGS
ncbi:MAG: WXG100 family type VII secretion target [Actinomycetota bacterium]|jgi:WXG100 family type VII secretion target|nr:WXG100 family type VII secretion target [Actinomycetota bacterium]